MEKGLKPTEATKHLLFRQGGGELSINSRKLIDNFNKLLDTSILLDNESFNISGPSGGSVFNKKLKELSEEYNSSNKNLIIFTDNVKSLVYLIAKIIDASDDGSLFKEEYTNNPEARLESALKMIDTAEESLNKAVTADYNHGKDLSNVQEILNIFNGHPAIKGDTGLKGAIKNTLTNLRNEQQTGWIGM